ncbi:helix-turn-helix domain-containing protein [Vibrio hangzhouensis]|uniref:helix-turn-helix domain-containing protein n=1 Tax=Vibrio hangzhouensis TaxID=462991 RepID=UPI001C963429|nr:helix-turn-helix transcriptional regulator [Vibrio hangzhouensis]MBY6198067.1 helix-turn-helix domain-containing protein [Vibrio hangzhouensis]
MNDGYQERITALIKEHNVTNHDLAEAIGKGKATIGRYLTKGATRTYPSIEDLCRIADYFNVQAHWLCFGVGDKHADASEITEAANTGAATVPVYNRGEVNALLKGESVTAVGSIPVSPEHKHCFGVLYPVGGTINYKWDCVALVNREVNWVNDDIVLARLPGNPSPDFFTLVKVGSVIHVWYGDDTSKNAIHQVNDDEIDVIGVVRWGTWEKRI